MEKTFMLSELNETASWVLENCKYKTLLFCGEMGAGKTTLIKEISKILGVNNITSSPTFSIVNEYIGDQDGIYHFDFYRIEHEEEAYDIGFEDYLYSTHWKFIEWPEKISNLLPEESHKIQLSVNPDNSRRIKID